MTNDLTAAVAELPEGPQIAGYTCLGCRHFQSEYWREPSGDGETWDSGTSADCRLIGKNISTYFGSEPHVPDWCPKPASGALVPAADVQGLVKAAKWLRATAQAGFRTADFHRGECACPRCAEDALFAALTAWENRNG